MKHEQTKNNFNENLIYCTYDDGNTLATSKCIECWYMAGELTPLCDSCGVTTLDGRKLCNMHGFQSPAEGNKETNPDIVHIKEIVNG